VTAVAAPRRGLLAAGAIALALLVIAVVLSPGGHTGTVRTVVGCLAVLVAPGWLVTRLADEEGDWITRAAGGAIATLGVCAICGFVAFELGLRVATAVFAVPLCVLVVAASLTGAARPRAARAPLGGIAVAAAIGVAALAGALVTHLVLPQVPVERAFSIESARAYVTPGVVTVRVTVARVRTEFPRLLTLRVDGRAVAAKQVLPPTGVVNVQFSAALHERRCPARVVVTTRNGTFLDPPVSCSGFG
jgi:hypothetical protein